MDEFLRWVLFVGVLEAALALGFVLLLRSRGRRTTGRAQFEQLGSRRMLLALLIPLGSLLVLVLVVRAPGAGLLVGLLLASAGCACFQPHPLDQVYGDGGMRRGWRSLRFEDLEEWRLTGDHLRIRLDGIWVAVSVPTAFHPEVRAVLESRSPDRESRFSR